MIIAGYQIDLVEAGRLRLDGGAMFGIVPKPLWSRSTPSDERNRITLAMRCLLLRGHGRTILVDTGVGHKSDEKFEQIYAVDHEHSTLLGSLERLGVAPGDVTDVILTHFHFDHVGGATQRAANGELELTFPEAAHYVQRQHLAWTEVSPREQASFLDENIAPIVASGRLVVLDGEATPFPHVSLEVVHGHTTAQQLPLISDGEVTLFYAADLIPTAAHVSPLWIMAYDVEPLRTLEEKNRILTRAAQRNWLVVLEHDPEFACARIESTTHGFAVAGPRADLPHTADHAEDQAQP